MVHASPDQFPRRRVRSPDLPQQSSFPPSEPPDLSQQTPPQSSPPAWSQDINVLALVKGQERYVFLYDDHSRAETLRTLGRYASNPELSFTWYDAAVLSQKIRQASQKLMQQSRFNLPLAIDEDDDHI